MQEKVLIESRNYNVKKFSTIVAVISVIISALILAFTAADNYKWCSNEYNNKDELPWCEHTDVDDVSFQGQTLYFVDAETRDEFEGIHPDVMSFVKCRRSGLGLITYFELFIGLIPLLGAVIALLIYLWLSKQSLTVTDKRAYGKASFGKRVDLPLDKISVVGTSFLKGIDVGTSSGRIKFKLVKNQAEVHSVMSNLLLERQSVEKKESVAEAVQAVSSADELKKFKELLDNGVITQEEFDAKKKQLLGL